MLGEGVLGGEDGGSVDDGEAAVAFAAHCVVFERLDDCGLIGVEEGLERRFKRTSWYHLRALSGRPYCSQCLERSWMRDGKTASKSLRVAELALVFEAMMTVSYIRIKEARSTLIGPLE